MTSSHIPPRAIEETFKDNSKLFIECLEDLKSSLSAQCNLEQIDGILENVQRVLKDINTFILTQENVLIIQLFDAQNIKSVNQLCIDLIKSWNKNSNSPSLWILAFLALCHFDFNQSDIILIRLVLMACILGELPHTLPYHNTLHFRKVLLHTIRMIQAHNYIYRDTINKFSKTKIASLLIAAAIHDLGHDGKGNIIDRKYIPARMEKNAFAQASPYLRFSGASEIMLNDIKVMLMTTDVSPFGDPISPSSQLRQVYEYHFGTGNEEVLELTEDFKVLEERPELCLLAMILHEADIFNSAALDYEVTKHESILISREIGKEQTTPEDVMLFLTTICHGSLISDAARFLGEEKFEEIYQRAEKDFKNGNHPYSDNSEDTLLQRR